MWQMREMSQFAVRMQPWLAKVPMLCGLFVPWMPTPGLFSPIHATPTGFRGPGGRLKKFFVRTPLFSTPASHRNVGIEAMPRMRHLPAGVGCAGEPGAIGIAAMRVSPSKSSRIVSLRVTTMRRALNSSCSGRFPVSGMSSILNGATFGTRTSSPGLSLPKLTLGFNLARNSVEQ